MSNDTIDVNLLGISAYSFQDDKSGKTVAGVNVWFTEATSVTNETTKGFIPKKVNMPYESFSFFSKYDFPQKAQAVLETRFTNRGVMTKIKDFKLLEKTLIK